MQTKWYSNGGRPHEVVVGSAQEKRMLKDSYHEVPAPGSEETIAGTGDSDSPTAEDRAAVAAEVVAHLQQENGRLETALATAGEQLEKEKAAHAETKNGQAAFAEHNIELRGNLANAETLAESRRVALETGEAKIAELQSSVNTLLERIEELEAEKAAAQSTPAPADEPKGRGK